MNAGDWNQWARKAPSKFSVPTSFLCILYTKSTWFTRTSMAKMGLTMTLLLAGKSFRDELVSKIFNGDHSNWELSKLDRTDSNILVLCNSD